MMHIDISNKKPGDAWLSRANIAMEGLKKISNKSERSAYIKNNQIIWKDIKEWLLDISYNKCWYSDVLNINEDMHVDHFRPKNRVKDIDGNIRMDEGYWWLAFDWQNYRIASTWSNCLRNINGGSFGKSDFFPVHSNSNYSDIDGKIDDEKIVLIDPINLEDVKLISFNEEGKVIALTSNSWNCERVEVSKKIYNLDNNKLISERRRIWSECRQHIDMVNYLIDTDASEIHVRYALQNIQKLISPQMTLSSVAIACLLSSGNSWAIWLTKQNTN